MSDNRAEIDARARLLVKRRGEPVLGDRGLAIRIGIFYIRVKPDDLLYINDQAHRNAPTVFSQREVDSTGTYHGWKDGGYENYADSLLYVLRQATVLEDLADV
jgi:hypothetical protein